MARARNLALPNLTLLNLREHAWRSRNANFIEILPLLSFRDNDIRGARIMQRYPKRKIAVSINAVTQR